MLASGKVDSDNEEDLIATWPSGLYIRLSDSGQWIRLSQTPPDWISAGDLNDDGLDDIIGSWPDDGVYALDSATGKWTKLAIPARQLIIANISGNDSDDLVGIWDSGLWVRWRTDSTWQKIDESIPVCIAAVDMTGNGRSDIIASYENGTWYRDSSSETWKYIAPPAEQLITSDIDGDGLDDLAGIWPDGVWARYGGTGKWQHITTSRPLQLETGRISNAIQPSGSTADPSASGEEVVDLSDQGPGSPSAREMVILEVDGPSQK